MSTSPRPSSYDPYSEENLSADLDEEIPLHARVVRSPKLVGGTKQYAPGLPLDVLRELSRIPRSQKTLTVYHLLSYRARLERSRSVVLTSRFLSGYSISRDDKRHALQVLEKAGLIRVTSRGRHNPSVEMLS